MSIVQSVCVSFKKELLQAIHDFGTDVIKVALYEPSATLDSSTTAYSPVGEITTQGYTAGGAVTTASISTDGDAALIDFSDVSWSDPNMSTLVRGALVYNSSKAGNPAICVIDFGVDKNKTTSISVAFPASGKHSSSVRVV